MRHVDRRREMKEGSGGGEKNHIRIKRDFMSPYVLFAQCFGKAFLRNIGRINCGTFLFISLPVHLLLPHLPYPIYVEVLSVLSPEWILHLVAALRLLGGVVPRATSGSSLSGHSGQALFSDSHVAIRPGM